MPRNVKCPECGTRLTKVVMTKSVKEGGVLRRRHCEACEYRWYTHQEPETEVDSFGIFWAGRLNPSIPAINAKRKAASAGRNDG